MELLPRGVNAQLLRVKDENKSQPKEGLSQSLLVACQERKLEGAGMSPLTSF